MAAWWSDECPMIFYVSFFFGAMVGGLGAAWKNGLMGSVEFWIFIIKLSLSQTVTVIFAMTMYRHYSRMLAENKAKGTKDQACESANGAVAGRVRPADLVGQNDACEHLTHSRV